MEIHTLVSRETARQQAYQSLAACWHIPDKPMGPVLTALLKDLTELDSAAAEPVDRMKTHAAGNDIPTSLTPEFTRLFIGPFHPPCLPYGSVYMEKDRTLMGDSTMDALTRYRNLGVDLDQHFKEAPDHICAELEFMCLLVYKELSGIRSGDPGQVQQMLAHQQSFLSKHLIQWIPLFTDRVMEHADSSFYMDLARATRVFVEEDHLYLAAIAAPADLHRETASRLQE
jgi:putative dimethyl sulfoxide reductase chaperone